MVLLVVALVLATLACLPLTIVAGNGTIYLHLGPAKTGSTHVQTVLSSLRAELLEANVCWPGPPVGKAFQKFSETLFRRGDMSTWTADIERCVQKGKDVIISSEHLFHNRNTSILINYFAPYKSRVKVILMYRELFSRKGSLYAQLNKEHMATLNFGDFLSRDSSSTAEKKLICFQESCAIATTKALINAFGRENMIIIDYDGVEAAKKDLASVILCDVIGVLCHKLIPQQRSNISPRMLPHQLIRVLSDTVKTMGCRLCVDRPNVRPSDLEEFIHTMLDQTKIRFPAIVADLTLLRGVSEKASLEWRSLFGDRMLYNNHTAAMRQRDGFRMEQLDERAFFARADCLTWLRRQLLSLYELQELCNCRPGAADVITALG